MSGTRGLLVGFLGLTALEAIVSSEQATRNAGGIVTFLSKGIDHLVNPAVPLVPDLRNKQPTK